MRLNDLRDIDEAARRATRRGYLMAFAAVAVAGSIRLILHSVVATEAPFLMFFAAVMASGWYGGFGPGLLATALCAAVSSGFLMSPPTDMDETTWKVLRITIFCLEGTITSALCGQLHAAKYRAERNAAEARDLERTVEQIAEAEQRRIGQDLHDGLGQHLTGVAFLSKALQQKLAVDGNADAVDAAATINQLMNEAIRWSRDLARGLAPMDLDRTSLPESLRELARKTSRMFSVECHYEGVEALDLAEDSTALNLYRVAQEAVSNAAKHGKARGVTIDLEVGHGLTLTIQDDGVGFDPAKYTAPRPGDAGSGGMGLLVMRYRAGVIGGKLDIRRAADGGVIVRCTVPADRAGATPRLPAAVPDLTSAAVVGGLARPALAPTDFQAQPLQPQEIPTP